MSIIGHHNDNPLILMCRIWRPDMIAMTLRLLHQHRIASNITFLYRDMIASTAPEHRDELQALISNGGSSYQPEPVVRRPMYPYPHGFQRRHEQEVGLLSGLMRAISPRLPRDVRPPGRVRSPERPERARSPEHARSPERPERARSPERFVNESVPHRRNDQRRGHDELHFEEHQR